MLHLMKEKKMKKIILVLLICISFNLYSNIQYINLSELPNIEEHEQEVLYVINHQQYFYTWYDKWNFDINKNEIIDKLINVFEIFENEYVDNIDNIELCLFLGDIAHYLYNLDQGIYHQKAIDYYDKASEIESRDYRSEWFKGFHLSQSSFTDEGMDYFLNISDLVPSDYLPPGFWNEFTYSAYYSQMYYHVFWGYENFKKVSNNGNSQFLDMMVKDLNDDLRIPEPEGYYSDIWSFVNKDEKYAFFINYMYGINLRIDQRWDYQFSDSENGKATVFIRPEQYIGYRNEKISVSYLLLMKENSMNENLETFLKRSFLDSYHNIEDIDLGLTFENSKSFLVTYEDIYPDQGGSSILIVGIEQKVPNTPGLNIEIPGRLYPNDEGLSYFNLKQLDQRFENPIQYLFLFDSCGSIYDEASKDFIDFIINGIVLE